MSSNQRYRWGQKVNKWGSACGRAWATSGMVVVMCVLGLVLLGAFS